MNLQTVGMLLSTFTKYQKGLSCITLISMSVCTEETAYLRASFLLNRKTNAGNWK